MASGNLSLHQRQNLFIDADDTLWENNIYFERAFDEFCDFLAHSSMSPVEIRAVLDEIEIVNSKVHGYGTATFGRNLSECYHHLAERDVKPEDLSTIMSFAERILDHPMELISGVEETLQYLSTRHDLTLMTKGHPEEQKLKLDRSGLATYFGHTVIVREKNEACYSGMVGERKLEPSQTWMIGNSPKSDINPALAAGLNAVFIPHPHTWTLEREEVRNGGRGTLIEIECFEDLRNHF